MNWVVSVCDETVLEQMIMSGCTETLTAGRFFDDVDIVRDTLSMLIRLLRFEDCSIREKVLEDLNSGGYDKFLISIAEGDCGFDYEEIDELVRQFIELLE